MTDELYVSVYDQKSSFLFYWSFKYRPIPSVCYFDYNADFVEKSVVSSVHFFKDLLNKHKGEPVRLNVFDSSGLEVRTDCDQIYRVLGNMKSNHNRKFYPKGKRAFVNISNRASVA